MENIAFETWLVISIICHVYVGFIMTSFSKNAIKKNIEVNALRKALLRAFPGSLLAGVTLGMSYASLLNFWNLEEHNLFYTIILVIGFGIFWNFLLLGGIMLRISQSSKIYGKGTPEKVKKVVKNLLKFK
jgi:predicted lipid-binding transport protein (Tim44 family)